ncbi:DNA/RNA non-specific endonuclease [Neolewinella agarilytica]|uniref:Endonuclease G n=1 Tax=Neolewinella agarilytica TaxID=478744 RepID=A0A1H9HE45_9BACT|nr:hypothetical protein [Neolewinella agarilytica]SEQ60609.1 endonuclease G [Neolewinella agarilytica]
MKFRLLIILGLSSFVVSGQTVESRLAVKKEKQLLLLKQLEQLDTEIEALKFEQIKQDLQSVGLPSGEQLWHSAMVLSYAEEYEQARWVAHIIRPEVTDGRGARTNDFREDPLVVTGSAVEADYFLKYLQPDSTYKYDGFASRLLRGRLGPWPLGSVGGFSVVGEGVVRELFVFQYVATTR